MHDLAEALYLVLQTKDITYNEEAEVILLETEWYDVIHYHLSRKLFFPSSLRTPPQFQCLNEPFHSLRVERMFAEHTIFLLFL